MLNEKLAAITNAIRTQTEAIQQESCIQKAVCELQTKLETADSKTAELTKKLLATEESSNALRIDHDSLLVQIDDIFLWFHCQPEDNAQDKLTAIDAELLKLCEESDEKDSELEDMRLERDSALAALVHSREKCTSLRQKLTAAELQIAASAEAENDQRRIQVDCESALERLRQKHETELQDLVHTHDCARKYDTEEAAGEFFGVQSQLEDALHQLSNTEDQLGVVTSERDDLRDELKAMADANDDPLLEEELALLQEQLDSARIGQAQNTAALIAAQEKHAAEASALQAKLELCQVQLQEQKRYARQIEVEENALRQLKDDTAHYRAAVRKAEEEGLQSIKRAQQFKQDVDKMWKKEQEKHNLELATLKTAHIQLEAEMLQAENNAVQLNEKLDIARKTIQELHARLEEVAAENPQPENDHVQEHSMMRRSTSRSQGRHTPESVMNELFSFLSHPPAQSSSGVPPFSWSSAMQTLPKNGDHLPVTAQANTAAKINRLPLTDLLSQRAMEYDRTGSDAASVAFGGTPALMNTSQVAPLQSESTRQSFGNEAYDLGIRSSLNTGSQYGSATKKHVEQPSDRKSFRDMLDSVSPAADDTKHASVATQAGPTKTRGKLRSLARSGRGKMDGKRRSLRHLAKASKENCE